MSEPAARFSLAGASPARLNRHKPILCVAITLIGVVAIHNKFETSARWPLGLERRHAGGDSFVSGLTYELLGDLDVDTALAFGIAHGTLAMPTPGDTSMATLAEVRRRMPGRSARLIR